MKKVITILIAVFLSMKILLVDTYALAFTPVMGEALTELIGGLLVGSGAYTTEEVSNMSWNECKSALDGGLTSGTINPLEVTGNVTILTPDGSQTTVQANYMEWLDYLTNPDTEVVASDLLLGVTPLDKIRESLNNIVNYGLLVTEVKANWVNGLKTSDVKNVHTVDMQGAEAILCVYPNYQGTGKWGYIYYGYGPGYVDINGSSVICLFVQWMSVLYMSALHMKKNMMFITTKNM